MKRKSTAKIKGLTALLTITAALNLSVMGTTGTMGSGLRMETASTQTNSTNRGGNLIGSGTLTNAGGTTVQSTIERGSPAIGTGLREESVPVSQTANEGGILDMIWSWVTGIIS